MGDGSQVAQDASDIVILNNSLESIATAVLFGRTMTESVRKFLIFQLTVNVSTIATAVIGPLTGYSEPYNIIQILFINLIMDTLAAMSFGEEPTLARYMKRPPITRDENILTPYMVSAIATSGSFITAVSVILMANFFNVQQSLGLTTDKELLTFMFTFFIYSILFNSLNTRSHGFNLFEHISENKKFIYIMTAIAIAQTFIIQFGGAVFNTTPMDLKHFAMALGMAFMIIPADLLRKFVTGTYKN